MPQSCTSSCFGDGDPLYEPRCLHQHCWYCPAFDLNNTSRRHLHAALSAWIGKAIFTISGDQHSMLQLYISLIDQPLAVAFELPAAGSHCSANMGWVIQDEGTGLTVISSLMSILLSYCLHDDWRCYRDQSGANAPWFSHWLPAECENGSLADNNIRGYIIYYISVEQKYEICPRLVHYNERDVNPLNQGSQIGI